jgi:hypothetical protein
VRLLVPPKFRMNEGGPVQARARQIGLSTRFRDSVIVAGDLPPRAHPRGAGASDRETALCPCLSPSISIRTCSTNTDEAGGEFASVTQQPPGDTARLVIERSMNSAMTRIGILGSAAVGQTLAKGFRKHGYDVRIGSRKPEKLPDFVDTTGIPAATSADTAAWAEILVLAVMEHLPSARFQTSGSSRPSTASAMR